MTKFPIQYLHQRGVALIVVLLFLILIALAGAMAVRQSNTDLKTATADQINTLLLQSSDSANQRLEAVLDSSTSTTSSGGKTVYEKVMSKTGMFGYYTTDKTGTAGNEYIYCYNPRGVAYMMDNATIKTPEGGYISNNGECDYTNANDFTSSRQSVMTQVNMLSAQVKPVSADSSPVALSAVSTTEKPFENMVEGKDSNNGNTTITNFDVRTTSILPSFSAPTFNGQDCLKQTSRPNADGTNPILTCLHGANTPSKMLYQQDKLVPITTTTECSKSGVSSAVAATCLLP